MSLAELLSLAVKWLLQLLVINVNGSVNGGIVGGMWSFISGVSGWLIADVIDGGGGGGVWGCCCKLVREWWLVVRGWFCKW